MRSSLHEFHIPVMGTGFTMDTPLRLARFGIDSVVSLGDDALMERLRRLYSEKEGLPFQAIGDGEPDARARRITAWLDFMAVQVEGQFAALCRSHFGAGSELDRYFSLLPAGTLRSKWEAMRAMPEGPKRDAEASQLVDAAVPGRIDVNIMTKVDRSFTPSGEPMAADSSDALSGLRGFARSRLGSTVVFSAGMNPRLYGYMTSFNDFFPDASGALNKKVCLKVSDFRSADIQGRFLAKKGIWVSEFRIESGLNCGGHAFAPQGQLLGPILKEFNDHLPQLRLDLFGAWSKALLAKRGAAPAEAPPIRLSVQGGVGTPAEHRLLLEQFGAQSIGWGTPFLLVPEATVMDTDHRNKLAEATADDVVLSDASPLGIPFWSLRTSSSEALRLRRIAEGKPGSPCAHSYLIFNTEFGPKPLCTSSRAYQRKKLDALDKEGLAPAALQEAKKIVLGHACICMDLSGALVNGLGIEKEAPVAVCPGPNIAWFDREASLEEMLSHIYGRQSLFSPQTESQRPHMFLTELKLSVEYLSRELKRAALGLVPKGEAYFEEYRKNLMDGMDFYAERSQELFGKSRAWVEARMAGFQCELAAVEQAGWPQANVSAS